MQWDRGPRGLRGRASALLHRARSVLRKSPGVPARPGPQSVLRARSGVPRSRRASSQGSTRRRASPDPRPDCGDGRRRVPARLLRPDRPGDRRRVLRPDPAGHPHRRRRDPRRRRALPGARASTATCSTSWAPGSRTSSRRRRALTVLGMNAAELAANPDAAATVVHDLNADPRLPLPDASFDAAVCCVSVDYLVRPVEVFADVARVVRPGGPFVINVLEPLLPDQGDPGLAASRATSSTARSWRSTSGGPGAGTSPSPERRTPLDHPGDPLYAVWARRSGAAAVRRLRRWTRSCRRRRTQRPRPCNATSSTSSTRRRRRGSRLPARLGPPLAALLVLALVAWLLGRRSRRRLLHTGAPIDLD